jgi:hypothetical protein
LSLTLLYDRADWSAGDYRVVPIMPSHRLLDERLRVQGVPESQVPQLQSWAGRLANACLMTEDESKQYYAVDFEDWVRTRTPEFLARHHLPSDLNLYDEYTFLSWIGARRALIAERLQGIYKVKGATESPTLVNEMREEDDDLSIVDETA